MQWRLVSLAGNIVGGPKTSRTFKLLDSALLPGSLTMQHMVEMPRQIEGFWQTSIKSSACRLPGAGSAAGPMQRKGIMRLRHHFTSGTPGWLSGSRLINCPPASRAYKEHAL